MEYTALDSFPLYTESEKLVTSLGYHLVELKISPHKGTTHILAVITALVPTMEIGVDDCSKVHHVLLPFLEEKLGTDDTYMELTSPGMERSIKNAAEFALFIGRELRVWDKNLTDWVGGKLVAADDKSLTLEITKDDVSETRQISFADIAKAKFIHL